MAARIRAHFLYVLLLGLVAAALLVAFLGSKGSSGQPADQIVAKPVGNLAGKFRPSAQSLMARGYLVARLGGDNQLAAGVVRTPVKDIYLPGIKADLVGTADNVAVASAQTDLAGRFTVYAPKAGSYKVCWGAAGGFVPGCTQPFPLGGRPQFLSAVPVQVARTPTTVAIYGRVQMADGTFPRTFEPMANINALATVQMTPNNGNARSYRTWVNDFGEYLIPQAPVGGDFVLEARIEGAVAKQPVLPQAELFHQPFHRFDLWFKNTPPRLEPLVPRDAGAGKNIQVASVGQTVDLKAVATDRDGDPLVYTWQLMPGNGTLSTMSGAATQWRLPSIPGQYQVMVIAWDKKGGYSRMPLLLRADGGGAPFSGLVVDTARNVVAGADVEINGQHVSTNANGKFATRVQVADRYVLNIRKVGYGLYSKIYTRGIGGGLWTLTIATTQTVNPSTAIAIVDRRRETNCDGGGFDRIDWRTYRQHLSPQWQDGKGNVIYPSLRAKNNDRTPAPPMPWDIHRGKCGLGMAIKIPANALVDENGHAPSGPVQVSVATVDLATPEQMPGDYTVAVGGGTKVMESFGAGSVEITAGGHRYNLKSGASALVSIPVDGMQLAAGGPIPATIPILSYDESAGVWRQEAQGALVGSGASQHYEAKVPHFSSINADTLKTGQACIRVLSPALPSQYLLTVVVPQTGGNAPKIRSGTMNNASPSEHVVYNLPVHTNVTLVATPTSGASTTPIGIYVVNTGGPQNPTTPNLPAGPTYTACSTVANLTPQTIPTAPSGGFEFLQGLALNVTDSNLDELNPANPGQATLKTALDQATADYYAQIDPRGKRTTLSDFRSANGFNTGTVYHTSYANSGDLGFGRDMYCVSRTASDGQQDYACYVSNYGDVHTNDQDDANDAAAGGTPVATVAMEYSRIESAPGNPTEFDDPERTVKFYVYTGAGNQVLHAANLDGHGARPVPQLCMVCHGGALAHAPTTVSGQPVPVFGARNDVKLDARFVPFDLRYYTFPINPPGLDKSNPAVQAAFKHLNVDIVKPVAAAITASGHDATPISEVVDEMYAGGSATQHEDFSVAGWRDPSATAKEFFYKNTFSNTCRMCHTAQVFSNIQFTSASSFISQLSAVGTRVCVQHVMPHAERTHEIFWGIYNPTVNVPPPVANMAAQLGEFGVQFGPAPDWIGTGGNPPTFECGTSFTSGGTTPLSYYQQTITPLWTNYGCVGCHGSSGGLSLGGGGYANLVNVNSSELASMKRVLPHDSAHSYLWHKLVGDAGSVGGTSPSRMPLGCSGASCVSSTDMNTIQNWIDIRGADGP